ncbi:hypothetical protein GCM10022225_83280 [Plantactinospora mayteni]|uniref:Uncharacterized protein n=1 Tax=Plantactinospora mayteni TaxID=566021 RepID=A0ABQ4F4F2_9ACTN|nr:hypothetical protein [Plantactinospora mayteni]GIH01798.1 hypothetical protein Pma05_83700 [Plantactinospora mayteni]
MGDRRRPGIEQGHLELADRRPGAERSDHGVHNHDATTGPDTRGTPPATRAEAQTVRLSQGAPATAGYWYDVRLDKFPPDSAAELVCRDSVGPSGFKTFSIRTDGAGTAHIAEACYSGDGPQHWITANGIESNRVAW